MSEYFIDNKIKKGKITGLCYSGFRDGQSPITKIRPTARQIREDFSLIQNCQRIRLYSLHGYVNIAKIAGEYNLDVNQGVWIDRNLLRNKREIALAVRRCKSLKSIKTVTVGNEVLKRKFMSLERFIGYIRQIKEQISLPVSTAEHYDFWLEYPELVEEVDFIALNIFPFWKGIPVGKAVDFIDNRVKEIKQKYQGKEIQIFDSGWPSAGQTFKEAVSSLENQKRYLDDFISYCKKNKLKYYYFEAFDEQWKRIAEKETGAHWGIYDKDRIAKF